MCTQAESRTSFKYPRGGLLQLQDAPKQDDLHHPTILGTNGEECLTVIKKSVIAEVNSRIVDILTGGAGQTGPSDEESVKKAFPSSYLYLIMA